MQAHPWQASRVFQDVDALFSVIGFLLFRAKLLALVQHRDCCSNAASPRNFEFPFFEYLLTLLDV